MVWDVDFGVISLGSVCFGLKLGILRFGFIDLALRLVVLGLGFMILGSGMGNLWFVPGGFGVWCASFRV